MKTNEDVESRWMGIFFVIFLFIFLVDWTYHDFRHWYASYFKALIILVVYLPVFAILALIFITVFPIVLAFLLEGFSFFCFCMCWVDKTAQEKAVKETERIKQEVEDFCKKIVDENKLDKH